MSKIRFLNALKAEVGKVALKGNGDKALSNESLLKSNSDGGEASIDDFP
jgi:hypothetical protein